MGKGLKREEERVAMPATPHTALCILHRDDASVTAYVWGAPVLGSLLSALCLAPSFTAGSRILVLNGSWFAAHAHTSQVGRAMLLFSSLALVPSVQRATRLTNMSEALLA